MKLRKYTKEGFTRWLKSHGCEILPATNEYESVRWKGKKVGVIYTTRATSGKYASEALLCFLTKKVWHGGPQSTGRSNNYKKHKSQLLDRDGSLCFYCHKELGEDITVEHLIELNQGGKNTLGNMVLAHKDCNNETQRMTVVEKVRLSINNKLKMHGH